MTKQQEFEKDKKWFMNNWDWVVNGNYGSDYYDRYKKIYDEAQKKTEKRKQQTLRMIVINSFTTLVYLELNCSYSTAQQSIVNTIPEKELAKFTQEKIKELEEIFKTYD